MQPQVPAPVSAFNKATLTKPMAESSVLYWFRNDLRLSDNPALTQACQYAAQHGAALALIVCLPEAGTTAWGFQRFSQHRKVYLAATIRELATACAKLGQRLLIVEGEPAKVLPSVMQSLGTNQLFCEQIAAPEEMAQISALERHGIKVNDLKINQFWQSSLLDPSTLPFQMNELPLVFTSFRNQVEKAKCQPPAPLDNLVELPTMPAAATTIENINLEQWAGESQPDPRSAFAYHLPHAKAGELSAQQHLHQYFDSGFARTYKDTRNGLIGFAYSTKFSPWLACGALSARQIYQQLASHEAQQGQNDSTYWIWFELLWRDYFRFLHLRFGQQLYHSQGLKSTSERAPQKQSAQSKNHKPIIPHHPELFERWCDGHTGQAMIDAGMRELKATGYLSNRMRQIVASYLVNDLQCDWRAGAAWFEAQLLDYDVYSNQGNWLYLAGFGTDPRANRRFNLEKQRQTYDPQSLYLKLWLDHQTS